MQDNKDKVQNMQKKKGDLDAKSNQWIKYILFIKNNNSSQYVKETIITVSHKEKKVKLV